MNGNFGNGMFNSTLIETDLDGNLVNNGEMPFWLRDIIERAFSASGIRVNRKVASKDAIASLQDVDTEELADDTCSICYDTYVLDKNKKKKRNPEGGEEEETAYKNHLDQIAYSMSHREVSIPTQKENKHFRDPSIFFPVDSTASCYLRFPSINLQTGNFVTYEEMFPALKSEKPESADASKCEHTPVAMPNCGHVFGKPCIMEWLNGHVSCPLCRKEVESLKETDPLAKKIATIRQNCNFVFTSDPDELVSHLAKYSTDVFNPSRKTMNPMVTPLTDSLVPQVWATPSYPSELVPEQSIRSIDPPLVMTRKFPLSHFGREPAGFATSSTTTPSSVNRPTRVGGTSANFP
ncbi:hypothetical protein JCM33374_g5441 [Metschnikowia sp. JCM 33374]|nr:hypothetical protein JCM33374_g5441 [Metschnikowia sp. JCM 33374]